MMTAQELNANGLDMSPTATPLQTRSGSPILGMNMPHTTEQAGAIMARIKSLVQRPKESVAVNVVDGSAIVPNTVKLQYLVVYFAFNLGLTLFNKAVMIEFPFPFLLTALHAGAGCIGTRILQSSNYFKLSRLGPSDQLVLHVFSLLYTINIAVSNMSLSMVTIALHQVVRGSTPVFTVLIYRSFLRGTFCSSTYISLIPVVVGVGLATYGDYYTSIPGFLITLLGAMLAAIKTIVTNRLQTSGTHISAVELLHRMSPLAFVQALIIASLHGEFSKLWDFTLVEHKIGSRAIIILLLNGAIALGLNIVSFSANRKAGALTMTVAANVKQILAVLLSIVFWHLKMGLTNALGILLTLIGGAWYARVEMASAIEAKGAVDLESNEVMKT